MVSFLRIVGTVDKIAKTSSNFTFSTIADGIEGIFKTAFEITFSKMT